MQLAVHSDALYRSVSQARCWASWVHFISKGPHDPETLKILCRPPTASYSFCARSCAKSWRQQMSPNTAPSLSTPRQLYLSAPPYLKWDGNRDPRLYKLKFPLQWASQQRNFVNKIKGHAYAFLLDKWHNQTGANSSLLETNPRKIRRLSFQESSTWTPHRGLFQIFTCA